MEGATNSIHFASFFLVQVACMSYFSFFFLYFTFLSALKNVILILYTTNKVRFSILLSYIGFSYEKYPPYTQIPYRPGNTPSLSQTKTNHACFSKERWIPFTPRDAWSILQHTPGSPKGNAVLYIAKEINTL